jgi:hypothetical protein
MQARNVVEKILKEEKQARNCRGEKISGDLKCCGGARSDLGFQDKTRWINNSGPELRLGSDLKLSKTGVDKYLG